MITPLLATATALMFGGADFLGGFASKRDSAISVTATSHMLGLAVFTVAALFVGAGAVGSPDLAWGGVAGVSGGIGVAALYAALARGRMSVVAPITAALAGAIPATVDLARGTPLGATTGAGIVLALAAVIVVSAAPNADDGVLTHVSAIPLALLSGFGFAGSLLSLANTSAQSGLWPLVGARVASVLMLGVLATLRNGTPFVAAEARRATLFAGVFDSMASITMLFAIRIGPLAVASVLGSLYPVVVVLLARFVLGERLRWLQRFGVAAALVAVILTALP